MVAWPSGLVFGRYLDGERQVLHPDVHQKPLFIFHGRFSSIMGSIRWAMICQMSLFNRLTLSSNCYAKASKPLRRPRARRFKLQW